MAIADGFIGTNNGMGQGLAYVLPQSKSEDYALKMAQDESRQLAATAAAKLKRQQLLQDNIGKQFAAQKLPALWSPYNAAVSDAAKQWQTKAATFNANAGQSPFTNPELMNEYNTNVLGLAQKSKELGDKYTKLYSTAVADGGNKYTPESVKNVLDFEETVKKDPMAALNMPLPELKPASATFDDFNKLIKPIGITNDNGTLSTTQADRGNHITQGLETVTSNPEKWNPMTEKQFGLNLYLPTFPIKNAQGRNIYPTNDKALDKFADNILSQQDAPEKLADFGISPEDEFAKEKLVDAMRKQNAGMGKFLTSVADLADAKVAKKSNYDNWREKANYSNSLIEGRDKSGNKQDEVYKRSKDIDAILSGDASTLSPFVEQLRAKGNYGKTSDFKVDIDKNNDIIKVTVPEKKEKKIKEDKDGLREETIDVTPAKTFTIYKNRPEARAQVNEILSFMDKNIDFDKVVTGNPSKKYSVPPAKQKAVDKQSSKFKSVPKGGF